MQGNHVRNVLHLTLYSYPYLPAPTMLALATCIHIHTVRCVWSSHSNVISTQRQQHTRGPCLDSSSQRDTDGVVRLWDRIPKKATTNQGKVLCTENQPICALQYIQQQYQYYCYRIYFQTKNTLFFDIIRGQCQNVILCWLVKVWGTCFTSKFQDLGVRQDSKNNVLKCPKTQFFSNYGIPLSGLRSLLRFLCLYRPTSWRRW